MGDSRVKKAAEWFYSNIFRDECIRPKAIAPSEKLPPLLRTARSLENGPERLWQSRESVFYKQAKLLASYEDDYPFNGTVLRYYPTYQSLTDQELRGYFSWRTQLRKGNLQKTSLSFAFIYIYELINNTGVRDALDGYQKLKSFQSSYGQLDPAILPYLNNWLMDYVVYYGLDPSLLADTPAVIYDRSITVLDRIQEQSEEAVMSAVKQLALKWLSRSKFYSANQADCDTVIVRILRKVSQHYGKNTVKSMVEQYFGKPTQFQGDLFNTAVFCNPLKRRSYEYTVDERRFYRCANGLWTVTTHPIPISRNNKLDSLLKTIDAVMREEYGYKHPVKYELETKWLLKLIREEIQAFLAEKKAVEAQKLTIDYSQLAKIRREASITQEKLTVEEEPELFELTQEPDPSPVTETAPNTDMPLSAPEYRLLHCLLYGGDTSWVQQEGHLMSVLVDGINEKLYDTFLDSVLDDTPALIEDYINDLKEMIHP